MNKTVLTLILAAAGTMAANAESEILKITFSNGKTQEINVADIDKMTFEDLPVYEGVQGDLLDIVFNADGTATDISPMRNEVTTNPGKSLMTYYNELHGRYVANFQNPLGGTVTDSYYRINYAKDGDFINRIADGCTFETLIKLNETNPGTAEVKWFSSMQSGGIGFLLPIHGASSATRSMTFLPNTGSAYRWTYSNVEPEAGKYYHVVGVYNKAEGKSYVYVNGKLCGTVAAPGNYTPVAAGAESFIIGGDPANNQTQCTSSWNGEIAIVRIYDDAKDAKGVAELWEKVKFDQTSEAINIKNLCFLPTCEVAAGYTVRIYGEGFEQGDKIEFVSSASGKSTDVEAAITADAAEITIPAGLTTGDYRVILHRGEAQTPLCVLSLTVSASAMEPVTPKVIAHRGAHTEGRSENSIAALEKAMDLNYYGIELDTWITTDGKVVVHHDGVANNLTFQNCTYDQIKNITLSNGEKLPTFDSFVESFVAKKATSDSKLIIEVKVHSDLARTKACIDKVIETINAKGIKDRVEFISFSYDGCKYIHQKDADYMIGYLSGDKTPAACKADGIMSIDYSYLAFGNNPEYIKQGRDLGMIVNVWTINTSTEMMKYWGMGVNYITTDAPAMLEQLCKNKFVEKK